MFYQEFVPAAILAPHVDCYWALRARATGVPERILPDGHGELVFHRGALPTTVGGAAPQPRALWIGQMRGPVQLQSSGEICVFGVRFRPAGASAFSGWSQAETTGQMIAFEQLFGSAGTQFATRLGTARNWAECVRHSNQFFTGRLRTVDQWIPALVEAIRDAPDARLSDLTSLSLRQTERLFHQYVGIGPKTFSRIARFQSAMRQRAAHPDWTWTRVAIEAGYYDQPHFIGDFRQFAGETPRALLRETSEMRDHLIRLR